MIRLCGLAFAAVYSAAIVWIYVNQPRTMAQVKGGVASAMGTYRVDQASIEEGLRLFRNEQFPEARAAFARADPAEQDGTVGFYVAYSYYRQGWGRLYHDDALYRKGLETLERAVATAPSGRIVVDDSNLSLRTSDELKAEFERGVTRDASDFNPMKIFRPRK